MLQTLTSADGSVVTIYSAKVAVGGLTAAGDGSWYWALFAVKISDLDHGPSDGPLGGVTSTQEEALTALRIRWSRWLDAAGLQGLIEPSRADHPPHGAAIPEAWLSPDGLA